MNERKLYCEFGCSSVYQYAERYLSLEGHTMNEMLRTGKALSQLPLLSEAYVSFEKKWILGISQDQGFADS